MQFRVLSFYSLDCQGFELEIAIVGARLARKLSTTYLVELFVKLYRPGKRMGSGMRLCDSFGRMFGIWHENLGSRSEIGGQACDHANLGVGDFFTRISTINWIKYSANKLDVNC